jgi:hypothetical protein
MYPAFRQRFCADCPDASPRPPEWAYSDEWQEQENKRREDYMNEFDQRFGAGNE